MNNLEEIEFSSHAHLHGYLVVEELRRAGVELFCVSPGARLIPILKALESLPQQMLKFFNDERSAAFYAQGVGKAGGLACVLCTSGTAAANYFPAVVEASLSQTPMLLVTTDRPTELLYTKSNQTIDQTNLYGDYVRAAITVPAIESKLYPQSLLSNVDQAVATALRESGPVQLNIAYRKPFVDDGFCFQNLEDTEASLIQQWSKSGTCLTQYQSVAQAIDDRSLAHLTRSLETTGSVAIVCGPLDVREDKEEILKLSDSLRAPLFADLHSGLRSEDQSSSLCVSYNSYLKSISEKKILPETILYFGDRIVSEPLRVHLTGGSREFFQFSSYPGRQDGIENEHLRPTQRFVISPSAAAKSIRACISARSTASEYATLIFDAEKQTREKLIHFHHANQQENGISESAFVQRFFDALPQKSSVFVSASLLLREAEHFSGLMPEGVQISANRGATGIDGVLSSALGFAAVRNSPLHVLIGDQALLHDLNALSLVQAQEQLCHIFVVNNSGGSIFHFFNVGKTNQMLENAHPWQFEHAAKMFDLAYENPKDLDQLTKVWQQATRSTLFELKLDGEKSVADFKASDSLL